LPEDVVHVRIIRSIQVNPDSIDLAYMDDADVRLGGVVFQTHHISISRGSNYDNEIDALEAAAEALLTDCLEDFVSSPAYAIPEPVLDEDDEDDDEDNEGEAPGIDPVSAWKSEPVTDPPIRYEDGL
jgi:hypothetical protein